jgi:SAM-dependent methyltransferase
MTIAPTLQCGCAGRFLEPAFAYDAPPDGETRFDLGAQPYRRCYDRCSVCAHWFGRHELDLSELYGRAYVEATYGGRDGMRARFERIMALPAERSDNRQRVDRVLGFAAGRRRHAAGTRPRLLDVGAGIGVFPAAMTAAGWQVTALEPDARTVVHLREVAGVTAAADDLLELVPDSFGRFDAVTLNKVLEHVEDPIALLRRAVEFLDDGGFIYLELPDVAAAVDGPGREEFFVEHHHVFSPASTLMLADRAGLSVARIERLREPSGKYTLCGFLTCP